MLVVLQNTVYLSYRNKQKDNKMTTQEFLTENRSEVINYYNSKIEGFYNVSIKEFMLDLMNNFRKVTIGENLHKMDLSANLREAQSRLGNFDVQIGVSYSKPYAESNHAKAVAYHGADTVKMMSNAN